MNALGFVLMVEVVLLAAAVALNVYAIVRLRRARKAIEHLSRPPMLPRMKIDEHGRIVSIAFDLFDLDSGASVDLLIPIIEGLGEQIFVIEAEGGVREQWVMDFDTGSVRPLPDGEPIPDYVRRAFE